jgi:transcriptional regulator with XRE-family HTH domain
VNGWELRERRSRQRVTLAQVARAAGTSESNVSAYERGTKRPADRTLRRLLAAIDAGQDSPIHSMALLTFPAAAALLRRGLGAGWSTADLLRVVRELRSNAWLLATDADRAAYLAEPSTTGDQRWDAMLAANAENLALRADRPAPEWSLGHALPTFWFVGGESSLRAYAFARTPISMQVRGVMVDPADLEAV